MSDYNSSRFYRQPDAWQLARGSITFDGTAGKGDQGTVTLFDVTGVVQITNLAMACTVSLVGANATLDFGVTGATDAFTFGTPFTATDIDSGMVASPEEGGSVGTGAVDAPTWTTIADIIATVATADITAGALSFFLWWRPLSADGNVALGANMEAI